MFGSSTSRPSSTSNRSRLTSLAPGWIAGVAVLGSAANMVAQDNEWTAAGDGTSFADPHNWLLVHVPTTVERAVFNGTGGPIQFALSPTTLGLSILDDVFSFSLFGNTYTVSDSLIVADGSTDIAELSVLDGSLIVLDTPLVNDGFIGVGAGSSGEVIVGAGGFFEAVGELEVGDAGTGILRVRAGGDATFARLYLADQVSSRGEFHLSSAGSLLTVGSEMQVGNGGSGLFNVFNGADADVASLFIGDNAGSDGHVVISGSGSIVRVAGVAFVANDGTALMELLDGGDLSVARAVVADAATSVADVVVRGIGSTFVATVETVIGNGGDAGFIVETGATASSATTFIGDDLGAIGTAAVSGAGSLWTNSGPMFIGNGGNGSLLVLGGATAQVQNATSIGDNSGGAGDLSVTGVGSRFTSDADLVVGNFGGGTVTIEAGGALRTTRTRIGDETGAAGDVTIDGVGSTWIDSLQVVIGNRGAGTAVIRNGATAEWPTATVGDEVGATGDLAAEGAGSTVHIAGSLRVGDVGQGIASARAGGGVRANDIAIGLGVSGTGGMIEASGPASIVESVTTITNGVQSPGRIHLVNGGQVRAGTNFVQTTNATLEIVLGSDSGTAVLINGGATLAGSMIVALADGFVPASGQSFQIIGASSRTGVFDAVSLPSGMTLVYEPNGVRVVAPVGGDPIATITAYTMIKGTRLAGGIPEVLASDDAYFHTRSGFGNTFIDLHNMEVVFDLNTDVASPTLLDLQFETRINNTSGTAQIRLWNWNTSQFQSVGSFALALSDQVRQINNVNAANYVNAQGDIRMSVKHLVFVPIFAYFFQSYLDQVQVTVE
jgi:T5SS/PEP-CTERM-associated repeat protein